MMITHFSYYSPDIEIISIYHETFICTSPDPGELEDISYEDWID